MQHRYAKFVLLCLISISSIWNVQSQGSSTLKGFYLDETLKRSEASGIVLVGEAELTSGKYNDPVNDGWLRLNRSYDSWIKVGNRNDFDFRTHEYIRTISGKTYPVDDYVKVSEKPSSKEFEASKYWRKLKPGEQFPSSYGNGKGENANYRITTRKDQRGGAILKEYFSSDLGVLVDLEFKVWGAANNNPGDGFSFFLLDKNKVNLDKPQFGAYGGSLGYAGLYIPNAYNIAGIKGGVLGVGIDVYGNFGSTFEGKQGGAGSGRVPNYISVRGQEGNGKIINGKYLDGYQFIDGQGLGRTLIHHPYSDASLTGGRNAAVRPSDIAYYRRILLEMKAVAMTGTEVRDCKTKNCKKYNVQLYLYDQVGQEQGRKLLGENGVDYVIENMPEYLYLGFASSTGGATNIHELRNLKVSVPGGVRIDQQVDKAEARVGDELTYTVTVTSMDEKAMKGLLFNYTYDKSAFKITSVVGDNKQNAGNAAFDFSTTALENIAMNFAGHGSYTFTIKGKVLKRPKQAEMGVLRTKASIDPNNKTYDQITADNTSEVSTVILLSPGVINPVLRSVTPE